jgi:hypothetical protein
MRYYLSLLPGEPEKQGDPLFRKLNGTQAHGTCAHLIERVCQALGFPRLLPRGARKSQVSQVSFTCLSTHCLPWWMLFVTGAISRSSPQFKSPGTYSRGG